MKQTRPHITEKSMALAQQGWYSFVVSAGSRKESIAKEIGALYNVTVKEVRTIRRKGKMHRTGKKMIMKRKADWKKALVRLAKGQKIAVFDIGEQQKA